MPRYELPSFDFSRLEPGDSFVIESGAGFTARRLRRSVLQAGTRWARKTGMKVRFESRQEGQDRFRVFMLPGAPTGYRSRKQTGF